MQAIIEKSKARGIPLVIDAVSTMVESFSDKNPRWVNLQKTKVVDVSFTAFSGCCSLKTSFPHSNKHKNPQKIWFCYKKKYTTGYQKTMFSARKGRKSTVFSTFFTSFFLPVSLPLNRSSSKGIKNGSKAALWYFKLLPYAVTTENHFQF